METIDSFTDTNVTDFSADKDLAELIITVQEAPTKQLRYNALQKLKEEIDKLKEKGYDVAPSEHILEIYQKIYKNHTNIFPFFN